MNAGVIIAVIGAAAAIATVQEVNGNIICEMLSTVVKGLAQPFVKE